MGLAASQARLLLLTARKNDVESQMMTISNEKLALSRQSAEISQQYSNALNTQKLAWSSSGDDVSYDLLMHPNKTVNTGQYMLTNTSSGAVILDSEYQSKLGLTASGSAGDFLGMYPNKATFIAKCMGVSVGQVPTTDGSTLENFSVSYSDADVFTALNDSDSSTYSSSPSIAKVVNFFTCKDGVANDSPNLDSGNMDAAATILKSEVVATTNETTDALMDILQNSFGNNWNDELESALCSAAYAAQTDTINFYNGRIKSADSSSDVSRDNSDVENATAGSNKVMDDAYGNDELYVDRTQMVKTFLAYFDSECAKIDGNDKTNSSTYTAEIGDKTTTRPSVGGTSSTCSVTTADDTTSGDANGNDLGDAYESAYYANLYVALGTSGWQTNSGVDDSKTLQNQILNGNITLNHISGGKWESITSSDSDYPIQSEDDKTAISKAEADYNANKAKLDYKESQLDVSMNDLDTERSAIETETTSVQKIIDKNIESSFKMFQNA